MRSLGDEVGAILRGLRARPGFALAVVGALALGIGANAAIFSLMNALLLRPLPFPDSDRLVALWSAGPGRDREPFSIPDLVDVRERARAFEQVAAFGSWGANLTDGAVPERLQGLWSSPGFFGLLRVELALGRGPDPREERAGGTRVAVLGHGLWQRQFGGDPAVLGRTIHLNGEAFTVIGILPERFVLTGRTVDVIVPLVLDADPRRGNRVAAFVRPLARLRAGHTAAEAQAEATVIAEQLRIEHPDSNATRAAVTVTALRDEVVGRVRPMVLALQCAVSLVLLIGSVNLALVLLTRTLGRRGELAVRATLGASEGRLLRLVVGEGLLLAGAAGVVGLLLAPVFLQVLLAMGPPDLPRRAEIGIDPRVAGFALGLSLLAGLLTSLVSALAVRRGFPGGADASRRVTAGAGSVARRLLVAFEVGLSVVLLVGALLLVKSLARLHGVDPGFDPDRLLVARLTLPRDRYSSPAALAGFYDRFAPRLRSLPGVDAVAAASFVPLTEWRATVEIEAVSRPPADPRDRPTAHYRMVSPGYLAAMRIPLLRGRDFEATDAAGGAPVALLSRSLAAKLLGDEDPIGQAVAMDDAGNPLRKVLVVGVVGDVKDYGLEAATTDAVYVALPQIPPSVAVWLANNMLFVARTSADPDALAGSVRRELAGLDPEVPVTTRSMEEAFRRNLGPRRFNLFLVEVFALCALLLAASGTYAVNAQAVARRTRELGVRIALGARADQVLRMVIAQGLGPVMVGLVGGLLAAAGLLRFARGLLYDVSPHDPAAVAGGAVLLGAVALAAIFVPARRATRVHPAAALRSE
jgi:putative ABC transport system permease protein